MKKQLQKSRKKNKNKKTKGNKKMPELILIGFGTKDISVDLTGKTPEQAIEEAIEKANDKEKN